MSYNISPLCDVARTSDCGVFLFLTLNISPLCDVAQTSDCGTHCLILFFCYKPFMWTTARFREDARLRHYYSCSFLSRSHSDPHLAPSILFCDFGRTTARLLCYFPMHYCLYVWTHLLFCSYASCLHLLYLMSELSCEYFHSTHLACWFGQMLTKAISWMKSLIARPTPRGVPVSPARSRKLVTYVVYASATRNKSPRASLRRSKSCSILESCHSLRGDISTTVIIVS